MGGPCPHPTVHCHLPRSEPGTWAHAPSRSGPHSHQCYSCPSLFLLGLGLRVPFHQRSTNHGCVRTRGLCGGSGLSSHVVVASHWSLLDHFFYSCSPANHHCRHSGHMVLCSCPSGHFIPRSPLHVARGSLPSWECCAWQCSHYSVGISA